MAKDAPKPAPKPQTDKPAAAAKAQPKKGAGAPQGAAVAKGRPKGAGEVPPRIKVAFQQTVIPALMKERGYANPWQVPRLEQVVINMVKKHQRPTQRLRQGGIIEREGALHLSNVLLVCGRCDRPVRIGIKVLADDRKVRICKRCGEPIDKG